MDFKNLVLTILNSIQRLNHTGRLASLKTVMIILLKYGLNPEIKKIFLDDRDLVNDMIFPLTTLLRGDVPEQNDPG